MRTAVLALAALVLAGGAADPTQGPDEREASDALIVLMTYQNHGFALLSF